MYYKSDVVTINLPCKEPLLPGVYDLSRSDDLIHVMHKIPLKSSCETNNIINFKFDSNHTTTNHISVNFNTDLHLGIFNSYWTSDVFQLSYSGNGMYMLDIRLSGEYQETINEKQHKLKACSCSLCYLAKDVKYTARISSPDPMTLICITFNSSILKRIFNSDDDEINRMLHPEPYRHLDPFFNQCTITPEIQRAADELLHANPYHKTYRLFAKAKVLELIALYLTELQFHATNNDCISENQKDTQRLYQVKAYLELNYKHLPKIETLCRLSGLSRTRLTKAFRSAFGTSIYDYITRLRMEKAKVLLRENSVNIDRVADEVGYMYQANFARAFKKYTGISPKKYASISSLS